MTVRRFDLRYGNGHVELQVPAGNLVGVINGKPSVPVADLRAAVRDAIRNPIGSPRLEQIVHPGETVAVLVSDLTRSWCRSDAMVPVVVDELNAAGIPDGDILIMIAVGTHRAQTHDEHALLVTPQVMRRVRVVEHNCRDQRMTYLGTTGFGTPVSINEAVSTADRLVLTGGIVTHDMAGYGGGMKSILPGVSSYATIMAHHKVSLGPKPGTLNDEIGCGKTTGNVFYADIVEAGRLARPDFLVNTVINPDGSIGRVVAGDPEAAHREGQKTVDESFKAPIRERADVVIASCGGHPLDINFYQSTKSLYNAAAALKPGGAMVLLTESRESFGHPLVEFISTGFASNVERHRHLQEDYDIGKWVGFLATVYAEKYRILLYSSLADRDVASMGMTPVHSAPEAVRLAYELAGPQARTYVIPNASSVWPVMV
ncbi:MAG: nickel-dependent lactate racemase [Bacillota bacterium]|nr:nickel-dependent lactate racemase [Bacillota bacterium]